MIRTQLSMSLSLPYDMEWSHVEFKLQECEEMGLI
jgi:hypothetical protein